MNLSDSEIQEIINTLKELNESVRVAWGPPDEPDPATELIKRLEKKQRIIQID